MGNPHAANAVDSLFNGKLSGKRAQTVLTPALITDPLREFYGGEIGYDPCPAESSTVRPIAQSSVPWPLLWDIAAKASHAEDPPDVAKWIWQCMRCEVTQSSIPRDIRVRVVVRAQEVKAEIALVFGDWSGTVDEDWREKTFINPPFGDRGPEVILGDFRAFCAAFARAEVEAVMLCPARLNRKWWRREVFGEADAVCFLNPLKFVGYAQAFPAPLALAYKAPKWANPYQRAELCEALRRAFAHIGDTVTDHRF